MLKMVEPRPEQSGARGGVGSGPRDHHTHRLSVTVSVQYLWAPGTGHHPPPPLPASLLGSECSDSGLQGRQRLRPWAPCASPESWEPEGPFSEGAYAESQPSPAQGQP